MANHEKYPEDNIGYSGEDCGEYPPGTFHAIEYRYKASDYPEEAYDGYDGYDGYDVSQPAPAILGVRRETGNPSDRPLRMACIGPNFRVGGVRQHALALAKFLNPERVKITEFLVSDVGEVEACDPLRMPVAVRRFDQSTMDRLENDCDILLMWGEAFNGKLSCKRPLKVFVAHGETQWTRNALLQSSQVVDHVIAVSESVFRKVCQGFPATKILNGIDTSRLSQTDTRENIRRRYAFGKDDFVVGCVGRLTQEKQFDLLIRAISTLPSNHKLLIVGSGRRYVEWLDLANRLLPGRCAIVAAQDHLGDFYQAMDAFAMVSAHEGFGLVLAEAMMVGRPVLSTRVGVAPEIICDRVNGVFVEADACSIADTVKRIRANRAWAQGMAAQGRTFAMHHFNAAQMARRYEDLLCDLYSRRAASRGDRHK